jgi:hypothetical protein
MQPTDVAPFAGAYQLAVGKAHRMQRPFDLFLPELDEPEQRRIIRRQIIFLPDEAVENITIIRHPVIKLGSGQTIALQHQFNLGSLHSALLQLFPQKNHAPFQFIFNENMMLALSSGGCQRCGRGAIAPKQWDGVSLQPQDMGATAKGQPA